MMLSIYVRLVSGADSGKLRAQIVSISRPVSAGISDLFAPGGNRRGLTIRPLPQAELCVPATLRARTATGRSGVRLIGDLDDVAQLADLAHRLLGVAKG
jgi:hypothetical protein